MPGSNLHRSDRVQPQAPIRVLHVVGVLDRAGIETWLVNVVRNLDRAEIEIDFAVEEARPGAYDQEMRAAGCRIHQLGPRFTLSYGRNLRRALRDGGYPIIHCHHNHFSGYVMRVADHVGIPIRIAHSHTDTARREQTAGITRRWMVRCLRSWTLRHATHGLAASGPAAQSMFGSRSSRLRPQVLPCGLDLSGFAAAYDVGKVRQELRIPPSAWVVGHVGRMQEVKNHRFLLELFAAIALSVRDAHLLLIGDGPLRSELEARTDALGLRERVTFAGDRSDVPRLLCTAIDCFVFPSKLEGLGIALVEAQAAGLPCLVSDVVPREADVVPELVERLSLHHSWESQLASKRGFVRDRHRALERVQQSDFSIERSITALRQCYRDALEELGSPPGFAERRAG